MRVAWLWGAVALAVVACAEEPRTPEFSVAGFFPLENSGRAVYSFNPGWKFHRGDLPGAEAESFDDRGWESVNLPHGLELLPDACSGGANYQGSAWYRKHFRAPPRAEGGRQWIYFEAIMGRSQFWINGQPVATHAGGYLPVVLDVTDRLRADGDNVIAIKADNSDDGSYPPGKPQRDLDFCYFGGIYRDAWLINVARAHITDPDLSNTVAGGGVFAHVDELTPQRARLRVRTEVENHGAAAPFTVSVEARDPEGHPAAKAEATVNLPSSARTTCELFLEIPSPKPWSPDDPQLYALEIRVRAADGTPLDGGRLNIGLRTIEFRPREGLWLNGKPFPGKLIGGNRHQDYAYVGNALPNSGQWRDAWWLRGAGMRMVRSAHYPMDPAFMDACDQLGLFVSVATPGWQFWNNDPSFGEAVFRDIRAMVRRDRNHPSVLWWEPTLNESHFPAEFGRRVHAVVREEYPYGRAATATDASMPGEEEATVIYQHPPEAEASQRPARMPPQVTFTREWGDDVDDWSSHNSPSRVARGWGEAAQIRQLIHYSCPPYAYSCLDSLDAAPPNHIGGCLWNPFDHQRGYHPDPFWGGILDAFRQTKMSWYLFASQRDPGVLIPGAGSGPMIHIAHEMTPVSGSDVIVLTNCEEVRFKAFKEPPVSRPVMPVEGRGYRPSVVFTNAFDFQKMKELFRTGHSSEATLVAEGLIGGQVVARDERRPATRPTRIRLELANAGVPLTADGSDFISVIASVTDNSGNVKRLHEGQIRFEVSGEGVLIGDASIGANPRAVSWGTAPALIRSTGKPGAITIRAVHVPEGRHQPAAAELKIESVAPRLPAIGASTP